MVFKTTVSYKDFNDLPHVEDLYFHLMTPEFVDLEFNTSFEGGLSTYVKQAMSSGDGAKIYTFFKLLIVNSYGRRSEDGSEFTKKPEFTEKFLNSNAYEEFFMWLVTDPKNAEQFWNGIVPTKMLDKVTELEAQQDDGKKKRIQDMSKEELVELMNKRLAEKSIEA